MKLHESPVKVIHSEEYARRILWIGAVSFESRCVGSITSLLNIDADIWKACAFDYPTSLASKSHGEENRALNKKEFIRLLGDRVELPQIHPYRYAEFVGQLENLASEATAQSFPCQIIVDITCLTKIHTLALAYWLLTREDSTPVSLAYSQPEHYGNPSRNIWGRGKWITTLQVRLDLDSTEPFSSTNIIAVLGHEGDRLRLAMNEAEADQGLIVRVLPLEPIPSRLLTVSDIQNAWLLLELQKEIRPGFNLETIQLSDLFAFHELIISYSLDKIPSSVV